MTSKLKSFIQTLNDFELASMYKYRYTGFLPDSRAKIDAELSSRGITPNQIEQILKRQRPDEYSSDGVDICKRCGCKKLWTNESEQWHPNPDIEGKIRIFEQVCMICGI